MKLVSYWDVFVNHVRTEPRRLAHEGLRFLIAKSVYL